MPCRFSVRQAARLSSLPGVRSYSRWSGVLAEAWPADVPRETLVAQTFRAKRADETYRARLRVEIGRLRRVLRALADIVATKRGFAIVPRQRARDRRSCAAGRRRACSSPRLACRRGVVVEFGPGTRARARVRAPSSGHSSRSARAGKVQALGRGRARRWMTPTLARIHDNFVTPRSLAERLGYAHEAIAWPKSSASTAPFRASTTCMASPTTVSKSGSPPETRSRHSIRRAGKPRSRLTSPRMPEPPSTAGTCSRSPRIGSRKSTRTAAGCSPTIPAPGGGADSGLAWHEGMLWVGQYRDRKIHQIDPQTGKILRTIESKRFVTGVTWVDGELWHGTWEGDKSDLRRVDACHWSGARDSRLASGGRRLGARIRRRRSVLLRRRPQRQDQSDAPTQAFNRVRPLTDPVFCSSFRHRRGFTVSAAQIKFADANMSAPLMPDTSV